MSEEKKQYRHSDGELYDYPEDPGVADLRQDGQQHISRNRLERETMRVADELQPEAKIESDKTKTEEN